MHVLNVETVSKKYPIYIGEGECVFDGLEQALAGKHVLIVTNTTVAPLYLKDMVQRVQALNAVVKECILPDGEQYKTLDQVNTILDVLMAARFSRNCTVVALGGGVVGDMTGFAAAIYQRGVAFIQVPTTLLAQVDSSVGGKTGVNHALGKNMIGAFKQPNAVFIDTRMLSTLPDRELSAGLAEVIKYALIKDVDFLQWIEAHIDALRAKDAQLLARAIVVSCQHKADIVGRDELESGERALLNLGHTFGHAIETHMGYGTYLHGEAVSIGMLMATYMSHLMQQVTSADVVRVQTLLARAGLPVVVPEHMTPDDFLAVMAHDKKNISGQIRLILLKKIGLAYLTEDYSIDCLLRTLGAQHFDV